MRGDPPADPPYNIGKVESTPHARGSTPPYTVVLYAYSVYPACAGIHLWADAQEDYINRLPRMRGDPPATGQAIALSSRSTPHARGSTAYSAEAG